MKYVLLPAVILVAVLFPLSAGAQFGGPPPEENPDPGYGGGGGEGCYECSRDPYTNSGDCELDVESGNWADCTGGQICWNGADGSQECQPYCGEHRCYLA